MEAVRVLDRLGAERARAVRSFEDNAPPSMHALLDAWATCWQERKPAVL
jgi:hypothetical protein